MVVRMTTSRYDDVILRSEAPKDLFFLNKFLAQKARIYALLAKSFRDPSRKVRTSIGAGFILTPGF